MTETEWLYLLLALSGAFGMLVTRLGFVIIGVGMCVMLGVFHPQ